MNELGTIAIDGSKFRANASGTSMKNKKEYDEWEVKIKKEIQELHEKGIIEDSEDRERLSETNSLELPKELEKRDQLLKKIKIAKVHLEKEHSARKKQNKRKKNPLPKNPKKRNLLSRKQKKNVTSE